MVDDNTYQSSGLGLLETMAYRPEVRDIWFNGKVVQLDGYKFISCRFDNCQLKVATDNFEMHRCFLDNESTIVYHGNIRKVIQLFNSRFDAAYKYMPALAPNKHEDGTISINL